MLSDAKIFWWPEMRKDIEHKVKDCTACLATGKNLKYQILAAKTKSPKKRNSVRYPFKFLEKRHNRKSLEERFQSKIHTAISGTENNVKTDTGRIIHRNIISRPLFQQEKAPKRIGTHSLCQNNTEEPTLPTRTRRQIRKMG